MRLMSVTPSFNTTPMPSLQRSNAVRMAGYVPQVPFEIPADILKQALGDKEKALYRQLGEDKVLSLKAECPQVAGTKYSLHVSILGKQPGSYYKRLVLTPETELGNTFTIRSVKNVLADTMEPMEAYQAEVPVLQDVLKRGREIDKFDFMDVTDLYDAS